MLRLLTERMNAGVDVRIIGSQSLRRLELEKRREIGVIVTDGPVVKQMRDVFAWHRACSLSINFLAPRSVERNNLTPCTGDNRCLPTSLFSLTHVEIERAQQSGDAL
jgi:hypothetical protein